ncbi:dTDP-4-dehydrorhamnose reductase [Spiribacter vilamensis]|uniref:dTDP-4-dehydrorhamnose reductase n=2 Tax=Spiribacter vilamensis TaxID=531306 RepID=A0A4Q8CZB3_9GAMM|nr:dTDP-4-dehydrorhamnose reductase [Spiribacter vilamensis]TVO62317.1 dTDP-4-dehydrorhamnose reductase [Spiribacter vilamensis]
MTILVIGASGQLASHLREQIPSAVFRGRVDLDLAEAATIGPAVQALAPSLIINAAAYTDVDGAESEPATAWRINAEGPAALARVAEQLGVPLIHISTDYVFDGSAEAEYGPDAGTCPVNTYGRTKLAGELAVTTLCERHWILRVSWVFSEFGSNFVKTMLRVGAERDALQVVSDQYGRPTYAGDIATVIRHLATSIAEPSLPWGIYHAVGGRIVSWYEFAGMIFREATQRGLLEQAPAVEPIATASYPTPATRPLRAVLAPSPALNAATGYSPDWEIGLTRTLQALS